MRDEVPDRGPAGGRGRRDDNDGTGGHGGKRTVSHILGMPVPYYVMVDMRSFREVVDAVGGVRVCVNGPVPVPGSRIPAGALPHGCRTLAGREALWYGRSRTGGGDYVRMGRQKCLLWALARQAGPLTVLRGFQRLTEVFRESVGTDVPQRLLPDLVDLSAKIRGRRGPRPAVRPAAGQAGASRLRGDPDDGGAGGPGRGRARRAPGRHGGDRTAAARPRRWLRPTGPRPLRAGRGTTAR
ncbi:LCP family protein [Actinomadura sp. LOL_011]|uniref:LCP family protein n=1 Tax=Actinomadura sp. LOL_011 TaxID=3345410 RepID=UPI003A808862